MRRNQTCKDQDNTEVFKEHKEGVEFGVLSTKERQGFDRRIKGGRMGLIDLKQRAWCSPPALADLPNCKLTNAYSFAAASLW